MDVHLNAKWRGTGLEWTPKERHRLFVGVHLTAKVGGPGEARGSPRPRHVDGQPPNEVDQVDG